MKNSENIPEDPLDEFHGKAAITVVFPWKACICLISILAVFCNSISPKNSGGCHGPTINSCNGSPCEYMHIFDSDGNFVKEGSSSDAQVYWDGTDCHGNKVGCGIYTCKLYLVFNGVSQLSTSTVIVIDSNSISKTGRSACDSLKNTCTGSYREGITDVIDGNSVVQEVGCICCR